MHGAFFVPIMLLELLLLQLLNFTHLTNACSGGGGSGCCVRAPPPPVATCGSGCQQGYQCGPYGCTKRKALSALTARINPNFIFHTCCEARGLPDACLRHCHFNTYTARALEQMFYKNDKCPIEAAHEIHYCAAQGMDHRPCCARSGVADTSAGNKCLAFCDQTPNRFTPVDPSYLPCYDIFENMKRCFFVEIRRRAEEKFGGKSTENTQLGGEF
ncbi:hypothetical protein Q1695_014529 [Nippostrongylus brasiliensis]|nr:hypothetical protein Q1695_014529 [Nippostrongylus brasiliensis]